jgi:hypothetical protein
VCAACLKYSVLIFVEKIYKMQHLECSGTPVLYIESTVLKGYIPEMTNTYTAQPKCRNLPFASGLPVIRHFGKIVITTKWKCNKIFEDGNEINCSEFGDLTAMLLQVHVSLDVTQCRWTNSSIKWRPCDFPYVRNFLPNNKCHNPEDLNLLKEINY